LAVNGAAAAWEEFAPHRALEATWSLIGATNAYLETLAPWKMEPGEQVDAVMGDALEAIRIVAILVSPAMPGVAEEIARRVGLTDSPATAPFSRFAEWGQSAGGGRVVKGAPLFPRIKSDE
jgi:methionyl-tRNA synthetase